MKIHLCDYQNSMPAQMKFLWLQYILAIGVLFVDRSESSELQYSCADYMVDTYNDKLDDGYYTIELNASYSDNITVYCHFNYTTQYAWTLIESFSLAYASYARYYAFYENYAYFEDYVSTYRHSRYRMSSTWMQSIFESMFSRNETYHQNPRKMMSTCNFDTSLDRDYLIINLDDPNVQYNPLYHYWSSYTCLRMESINIRGYTCENEDIYAYNGGYHLFVDSDSYYCDCEPWASTAVYGEDNFGHYYYDNDDFSCSASSTSTTNWWLGGYALNGSGETLDQLNNATFMPRNESFWITSHPSDIPTSDPSSYPSPIPTALPTNRPAVQQNSSTSTYASPYDYWPSIYSTTPLTSTTSTTSSPSSTNSSNAKLVETWNNTGTYVFCGFIVFGMCVTIYVRHQWLKTDRISDDVNFVATIMYIQQVLDLWTDLSLCVVLYYQQLYDLAIAAVVFVIVPYLMSVLVSVYSILKWTRWIQDHPSRLKRYLQKYKYVIILFSLFGGFYATIDLFRSKILYLQITYFPLKQSEYNQLKYLKFVNFILLESIPQFGIQLYYLTNYDRNESSILPIIFVSISLTVISLLFGGIKIGISVIDEYINSPKRKFAYETKFNGNFIIELSDIKKIHAFCHSKMQKCIMNVLNTCNDRAHWNGRSDTYFDVECYDIEFEFYSNQLIIHFEITMFTMMENHKNSTQKLSSNIISMFDGSFSSPNAIQLRKTLTKMLKLKPDGIVKMIFDSVQSMSVSTVTLNVKGKEGSAVDIWNNILAKPIPNQSKQDGDGEGM